jgi:hypothetical protein
MDSIPNGRPTYRPLPPTTMTMPEHSALQPALPKFTVTSVPSSEEHKTDTLLALTETAFRHRSSFLATKFGSMPKTSPHDDRPASWITGASGPSK